MKIGKIIQWTREHVELTETVVQVVCVVFIVIVKLWVVDLVFVLMLLFVNARMRMILWAADVADSGEFMPIEGIFKRLRR